MIRTHVRFSAVLAALVLAALVVAPTPGAFGQGNTIPAALLDRFIDVPEWRLDITWTAKDSYEDEDFSATLEMTATARLVLVQGDKWKGSWGRWHVEKDQSDNLTYTGILINKNDHSRSEYRATARPAIDAAATFEVGGRTPGYQLTGLAAYPLKLTNPLMGTIDSLVSLLTTDIHGPAPVFATGSLPPTGTTIHGSFVFPATVPPFGAHPIPLTRVGVQFVLQSNDDPLAPLVPPKKKK